MVGMYSTLLIQQQQIVIACMHGQLLSDEKHQQLSAKELWHNLYRLSVDSKLISHTHIVLQGGAMEICQLRSTVKPRFKATLYLKRHLAFRPYSKFIFLCSYIKTLLLQNVII